ncbi:MAG: phosphoribosylglycinamide formyltransferase, partial [Ignavibacteriales bacterium]|nr:phosphoribosylglycinamide formyltransferase [Ignavibacteriales bacterium]
MNIAVFASGRGSNLQAILNAIHQGFLPARVTVVLSNNSNAGALEIARLHKIPAVHLSQIQFPSEDAYVETMLAVLQQHGVELIALAGYMKKLPRRVIENFQNRILNIHPALLPAFGGKGMYGHYVHEAVIASGATFSGATVHLVDEEYDRGPIVMQQTVPVEKTDTPETLAAKILHIEHKLYVEALKAFAEQRVVIKERNVWIHSHN